MIRSTLCVLVLAVVSGSPLPAQVAEGRLVDQVRGEPVSEATLLLKDADDVQRGIAVSDATGWFQLRAPHAGLYTLHISRLGYRPVVYEIEFQGTELLPIPDDLLRLTPVATALDTVTVAGEAPQPYLRQVGFYGRREAGFGEFLEHEKFEQWTPSRLTDVLRRLRRFRVRPNPAYGVRGDYRQYVVESRRASDVSGLCRPLYFLDGAFVGTGRDIDVNSIVPIQMIGAIEAYEGAADVPLRFRRDGADCGVIVFWTKR